MTPITKLHNNCHTQLFFGEKFTYIFVSEQKFLLIKNNLQTIIDSSHFSSWQMKRVKGIYAFPNIFVDLEKKPSKRNLKKIESQFEKKSPKRMS